MIYVSDDSAGTSSIPSAEMLRAANELQPCVTIQIVPTSGAMAGGDSSGIDAIFIDARPQDLPNHFARAQRSLGAGVARVACVPGDANLELCLGCMREGADALIPQPVTAAALSGLWQHCLRRNPLFFGDAAAAGVASQQQAMQAAAEPMRVSSTTTAHSSTDRSPIQTASECSSVTASGSLPATSPQINPGRSPIVLPSATMAAMKIGAPSAPACANKQASPTTSPLSQQDESPGTYWLTSGGSTPQSQPTQSPFWAENRRTTNASSARGTTAGCPAAGEMGPNLVCSSAGAHESSSRRRRSHERSSNTSEAGNLPKPLVETSEDEVLCKQQ